MKLNILNNKKIVIPVVIILFAMWMLFFDANSYYYQLEYDNEIEKLQNSIEFYQKEIYTNRKKMEELSIQKNLNNYAREKYHYKKKKEYLYLIEYDTLD